MLEFPDDSSSDVKSIKGKNVDKSWGPLTPTPGNRNISGYTEIKRSVN
jgi:hypothetical protein